MALGDRKFGRGSRDLSGIRVGGIGPVPSTVMFIGERPGKSDVSGREPQPYRAIGGQELDRYAKQGGVDIQSIYTTFLVKDYRDGESVEDWEIARDSAELEDEICMVSPSIIATAGTYSTRYFLGPHVDLDVVRGVPHWFTHDQLGPILIVPISHPGAAFYNADNQPDIIDDFRRLGRVIRGSLWPLDSPSSHSAHEPNWINPFHIGDHTTGGIHHLLALDTEGWLHRPWGLSESHRDGSSLVMKKGDNSVSVLDYHINEACRYDPTFTVYLHNSLHDLAVLEGLGVHIPEGRYRDTMVYAYLLSVEPQGLKALSYRHLGMRMKSYEEVVAPYYRAVFEEWVRTAADVPNLPDWEEQYVIIQDGQPKIKKPWGIARHLRRILSDAGKAEASGAEFDFATRWDNIDDYKKLSVINAIGEPPENSIEYVPDDEAIAYSGEDAIATRRIGPILEAEVSAMGLETVCAIDHSVLPMLNRMQKVGMKADVDHFDRLAEECTGEMSKIQTAIQRECGALINPDSGDQVAAILFDQFKLERKVDFEIRKTDDKSRYSTNDKILEALRFTHPVVGLVCDYREVSKVRSSFCWPISRYAKARPDHRIHPNIRTTRVVSGRFSCTKPNLMAIPVRSKLGKRVREGFVADEGHVLGDWDLDQIEMRYMGDESQDPVLLECFRTGLDIHTKTASLVFGIPYNDLISGPKRKIYRDPAKRIGFGVITGITEIGLAAQMRLANATQNGLPMGEGGIPWTEDDCERLIKEYFRVHVGVSAYIDNCRAEARRFGFVRDRWGRRRLLPGVHSHIRHIREEAERQSHSHKISSGAQCIMKMGMALLWEEIKRWWAEGRYIEPLLQVHDELLFELEDDEEFKAEVDWMVKTCLTQAVTLSVPLGAAGGFGPNWAVAH